MSYTSTQDVASAAMKLGVGIDAFSAIIDSDEFVNALTPNEKDTLIGVLDTLDSMQSNMERFVVMMREDEAAERRRAGFDDFMQMLDDEPCDQPEQQARPCPGTCYECTKQDADEFWSGPAFFPAVV